MENYVENQVKTLITLTSEENKILTIISKRQHISKSKLISQMIESYIKKYDYPEEAILQKYLTKEYTNLSNTIKELREKWKKN